MFWYIGIVDKKIKFGDFRKWMTIKLGYTIVVKLYCGFARTIIALKKTVRAKIRALIYLRN